MEWEVCHKLLQLCWNVRTTNVASLIQYSNSGQNTISTHAALRPLLHPFISRVLDDQVRSFLLFFDREDDQNLDNYHMPKGAGGTGWGWGWNLRLSKREREGKGREKHITSCLMLKYEATQEGREGKGRVKHITSCLTLKFEATQERGKGRARENKLPDVESRGYPGKMGRRDKV